tara:strand:+ start:1704 stop:2093 length:390 start_codon:yes stop_codon:yes gene_type:complete
MKNLFGFEKNEIISNVDLNIDKNMVISSMVDFNNYNGGLLFVNVEDYHISIMLISTGKDNLSFAYLSCSSDLYGLEDFLKQSDRLEEIKWHNTGEQLDVYKDILLSSHDDLNNDGIIKMVKDYIFESEL